MNVMDFVSDVYATIGTWFYVVATLEGGTMKLYIDGELNMTKTLPVINTNNNVYIDIVRVFAIVVFLSVLRRYDFSFGKS